MKCQLMCDSHWKRNNVFGNTACIKVVLFVLFEACVQELNAHHGCDFESCRILRIILVYRARQKHQ